MLHHIQWLILVLIHCLLISYGAFAAEDPVEGENFIWVDLGENSKGVPVNAKRTGRRYNRACGTG